MTWSAQPSMPYPPHLDDALTLARTHGAHSINAIPLLAPALGYQDGETNLVYPAAVMQRVDVALDRLVRRMLPRDYIRIGQRLRAAGRDWPGEPSQGRCWSRLYIEHFSHVITGTNDFARLAILSAHANGRIRERAVRMLDRSHGKDADDALPFLLARCADWVAEVQQAARDAVRRRLSSSSSDTLPERFVALLPLVLRLRDFTRVRCGALVEEILDYVSNQTRPVLADGLHHSNQGVRRAAWDTLLERGRLRAGLALRCLGDSALTRRAGRYLSEGAATWPASKHEVVVDALSGSTAPDLRLSSLVLAGHYALPDLMCRLKRATHDDSRTVRQHARYHLRQAGVSVDHRRAYLEALPRSFGAVAGLGEVGAPEDWEALVPCLEQRSRVASEAVHAMRMLNAGESREMRLFMVGDARPKVSCVARASVERGVHAGEEAAIVDHLASPMSHVRRNAIRLASFLPGWRAPVVIAAAIAAAIDASTLKAARAALSRWKPRPGPSAEEFEAWCTWMRLAGVEEEDRRARIELARWRFKIER